MPSLGAPELVLVLVVVLILFGGGKLAGAGKSLGQGIKEFRRAVHDEETPTSTAAVTECPNCHASIRPGDRFCGVCGQSVTAEAHKVV